jgi:ABC-type Fe3+/spermidine/putrescine transport system ATPase subunit
MLRRVDHAVGDLGVRNLLEARVESVAGGLARLRAEGGLALLALDDGGYRAGAAVTVGIRPERIVVLEPSATAADAPAAAANVVAGTLDDEIYLGERTDWRVRHGALVLTVAESAAQVRDRRRGDAVRVAFPPAAVLRLEP